MAFLTEPEPERGANLPSIESLLAICRAFDKRPSEVLAAIEF